MTGFSYSLNAQFSASNIYDYELGNIPGFEPADLSTHYDQLNTFYQIKNIRLKLRLESFLTNDSKKNYTRPSQYSFAYQDKTWDLKIGHFNDIIGKGLLLRAYEIPGSIYEDQAYRVRYGFYRDITGFSGQFSTHRFFIKALRGQTLLNTLPPTLPDSLRHVDLVEGIETAIRFGKQKFGKAILRNQLQGTSETYGTVYLTGDLPANLNYYVEYARKLNKDLVKNFGFNNLTDFAFYASLNFVYEQFGLSAEYKKYRHFFIGSGISDPPTLVKEQSYKLLNRSTHVPDMNNESGYQLEAYYQFTSGVSLTVNHSMAVNHYQKTYTFTEYFAEIMVPASQTTWKAFTDYSQDPFEFENNRYTYGISWERVNNHNVGFSVEGEHQWFRRVALNEPTAHNVLLQVQVSKSPAFTSGVVWEISTDRQVTDRPETFAIETSPRHFVGVNGSYTIKNNTVSLFVGTRRGGPSCTSGICYNVLDFKGAELRFTSRF